MWFLKVKLTILKRRQTVPMRQGFYQAKGTIKYKDGSIEEITVNVLVDPYGYVYEKNNLGEQRLSGVRVTLYVFENESWKVFDASKYEQSNPQTTLDNGEYGFMVPA